MNQMIVSVRDKMLRRIGGVNHFVTHNKDYEIQFQFDDSWADVRHKMAVFAYEDGEYGSEIFDGDTCNVPELPREGRILIGVKAGEDLSTELLCIPVCKSADDVITDEYDEPDPKIYEQILDIINNLWNGGTTVYPSPVRFLAAPNKAEVGQFVRVKKVNEDGEVEETEAVEVESEKELVVVNITEDADGVLHADMTYDEINPLRYTHAVYAKWASGMYPYSMSGRMYFGEEVKNVFVFSSSMAGTANWRIAIAQDGSVKISSYELELVGRKVQTVDETTGTGDDAEKNYPSAKAVYNALANAKDKDAVKFVEQELTEEQKQQARENIGAMKFVTANSPEDLCNKLNSSTENTLAFIQYKNSVWENDLLVFPLIAMSSGKWYVLQMYTVYASDGKVWEFKYYQQEKKVAGWNLTSDDSTWLYNVEEEDREELYLSFTRAGLATNAISRAKHYINGDLVFAKFNGRLYRMTESIYELTEEGVFTEVKNTFVSMSSDGTIHFLIEHMYYENNAQKEEYFKYEIPKNFPVNITSTTTDGVTTYTADKTFEEIRVAYENGASVYAVYYNTIIPIAYYLDSSGNSPDNSYIVFIGNSLISRVILIKIDANENIEIRQGGATPLYKWSELPDVMYHMDAEYPTNVICVSDSEAPDGGGILFYSSGANNLTINYVMITKSGNYYTVSCTRRYEGTPLFSYKIASSLPTVSTSDNNKILQVSNGTWTASDFPIASPTTLGGVKPIAKTDSMTQEVGIDADGKLYTKPSSSSGGSIVFEQDGDYISITSTGVTIIEENGYITIS